MQTPLQHCNKFSVGHFKLEEFDVYVMLNQSAYAPNQLIKYVAECHGNCSSLQGIQMKFKQIYVFTADRPNTHRLKQRKVLSQQYHRANIDSKVYGTLAIPDNVMPSSIEHCIVLLEYYVQIKLHLGTTYRNRKTHITIRIGNVDLRS